MHCYFVTEKVTRGFPTLRRQGKATELLMSPPVETIDYQWTSVEIAPDLQEGIDRIPEGYGVRIDQAALDFVEEEGRQVPVLRRCFRDDSLALVILTIQPGKGGRIWLTSTDTVSRLDTGKVDRGYLPLPAEGVDLHCEDTVAREIYAGKSLPEISLLLSMRPGAELRIFRSGKIVGDNEVFVDAHTDEDGRTSRPRELFLYWDHNQFRSSLRLLPRARMRRARMASIQAGLTA